MSNANLNHLSLIDLLIGDGILKKVIDIRASTTKPEKGLMITCGDMNHRHDMQSFFERKFGSNIHLLTLPGGAIEFSPNSPRNRQYPGDFYAHMRNLARAIVAQNPRYIMLLGHEACGSATFDGLDPIQSMLLIKDAKKSTLCCLAEPEIRNSVFPKDLWAPSEDDVAVFLHVHCPLEELPKMKHISQERTAWFLSHEFLNWVKENKRAFLTSVSV